MLMEAKAYNEAARALILWGALQVDLSHKAQTEEEREAANDIISLLTPVIKGYLTDKGYEVATNAQQIYGGHGYIREWGMEQFVRDARINMIYEGANGVQALDLVGLEKAVGDLQSATMWLMQNGMANPNNAGAASYSYMNLMGIVTLGLMWLRMAKASTAALAHGGDDKDFHEAKIVTARFYAERILPQAGAERRKLEAGSESVMALPVEAF